MAERRARRPRQRPQRPPDARSLAWEVLQTVEAGGYADAVLASRLAAAALDPRDQALATRLVYGTLAWQGYLDHILAAFSRRPVASLDPPVRTVLRLALFQICKLSRVPDFAAVDTAVGLVKRHRGGIAAGFVNAILRRAVTGWSTVPLPPPEDPVAHLAVRLSHPAWLVAHWIERLGEEETAALLAANNEPAPTVLRVNSRRTDRPGLLARLQAEGYAAGPSEFSPVGIRLEQTGGVPADIPAVREGLCTVQGEASQLVALLPGAAPGQRVLDVCAAPGGKATHLAELLDDRGLVLALDQNAAGLDRLAASARRLGLSCIETVVTDALAWQPAGTPAFDAVLVDAPCSGFGTLRAHPEIRWRRSAEDVAALAALQRRLLAHVAPCVRPGGVLVYATCTLTHEENEATVAAFLAGHPDFAPDDPRPHLPPAAHRFVGADLALRTAPHRGGLDGFFAVRLARTGPA